MKRIDIIVSMEMGGKIPTKEASKRLKDEVRKLKKKKKQIHHEQVVFWLWLHRVWTTLWSNQRTLRSYEWGLSTMIVFDIETDGLVHDVTTIHCLVIYDTEDDTTTLYNDNGHTDPIVRGVNYLRKLIDCWSQHHQLWPPSYSKTLSVLFSTRWCRRYSCYSLDSTIQTLWR